MFDSKYTGAQIEALLDKIGDMQLWGYECFAVKKAGMDDPDALLKEIEGFVATGGGDADALIGLMQEAGLGNAYIRLINSDEGETVCTINGAEVTIGAGETYEGYVNSWSAVTLPHYLKSVLCVGDTSVILGYNNDYVENYTLEEAAFFFSSSYTSRISRLLTHQYALRTATLSGGRSSTITHIFYNDTALDSANVSHLDTSNTDSFLSFFNGCQPLKQIDVSSWDTSKVTIFSYMFVYCSSLTSLDVSNFDTSKATTMQAMFQQCTLLEKITFGDKWDMGNVTTTTNMFANDPALTTIEGTLRNIKVDLSLSNSPLTRESALVVINGLYDFAAEGATGGTLTLSSTTKGYLTDDDIAIATDKGWTIA